MNPEIDANEIILDEFDTDSLPSLEDLMQELEAGEDADLSDAMTSDICLVVEETDALVLESEVLRGADDSPLKRENEELHALLKRAQQDFENYRRRVERERGEHYAYALATIVKELLPVLDNFHLAVVNAEKFSEEKDLQQYFDGLELIEQQFEKVLTVLGIERIPALGEKFNPQFHEAAAIEADSSVEPDTILEELARGYRLGEKLIRPALVKVSVKDEG